MTGPAIPQPGDPNRGSGDPAATGRPLVSVVMVTYGGMQWIPRALAALEENTQAPYEVIIVDNASADGTRDLLGSLEGSPGGPRVIFNERNVGFGPGCNQGVLHATAPFVCLLNSDAFVQPGWLAPLVDVLERDPRAGAAVPCLLHLDGRLQEAGGLVGCDGSTRALGDGASPDALEYRFRRYVDYGSAACLLMRRSVFARVGGFDAAYPLGYCEDVDLCFALRELGLRTVYEPASKVSHVRWGSSSRSMAERRVFANQPILLARWRERLAGRPSFAEPPFLGPDILAARDAEAFDRILLLGPSACVEGADSTRVGTLAMRLAQGWPDARVTLLTDARDPTIEDLLAAGVEVACPADRDGWFEDRRFHYSTVIVSGPVTFEHFDPMIAATQPQAVRVYDLERLAHRCADHLGTWWPDPGAGADGAASGILARRLRSLESWGVESADVVLGTSRQTLAFARSVAPHIPAYPVATTPAPGQSGAEGVVHFQASRGFLAGGFLPPGLATGARGARRTTVLGSLRAVIRSLDALGAFGAEADPAGKAGSVGSVGAVSAVGAADDVARLWQPAPPAPPGPHAPPAAPAAVPPARVHLLVPPFVGGAVQASISRGIPFVTWRGGVEDLDLDGLEAVLVADDPDTFARRAWALHQNRSLWDEVHAALIGLAQRTAGPGQAGRGLWAALAHCGLGEPVGTF